MTWLANLCARLSCDRWNPFRPLRGLFRRAYQKMGENSKFSPPQPRLLSPFDPNVGVWTARFHYDTYPWPYTDKKFANWPECSETGSYTLVPDPAGFVVKHCTSYCAWKIRELTGHWPLARHQPGAIYHAKDWQTFLAANGYEQVVESPEVDPSRHYVGIDPAKGRYGEVYWFDGFSPERNIDTEECKLFSPPTVYCSTYQDRRYTELGFGLSRAKEMLWIRIDGPPTSATAPDGAG